MKPQNIDATDSQWSWLFKIGGAAAFIMVLLILIQIIVFLTAAPPFEGSAVDWFNLFERNKLLGLVAFEFLMVVFVVLSIPMSLALYIAVHNDHPSLAAIYLAFSLVGTVAFIAARPAFEMLAISQQYTAATSEAQRTVLLAAGESMLAIFKGTAFQVSYYLGSLNGLVISAILLRSKHFSKATAYVRIASSVLDFGILVPTIGIFISVFSVVFLMIWNLLIARRLFQLSKV
jgi:hypothetical protein